MNKIYLVTIAVLLAAVFVALRIISKFDKSAGSQQPTSSESITLNSNLEAQTNSDGLVEIAVAPKKISGAEWLFEVALNTHSEELTANLIEKAVLLDDNGNEYLPNNWQGDPPGGHHRNGILSFTAVSPESSSVTVKIFDVGGIKERIFTWQLK